MSTHRVGPWTITHNPKPIPMRSHDWDFVHEDYDGAPDGGDLRCGTGANIQDCLEQIIALQSDEIEKLSALVAARWPSSWR